MSGRYSQPCSGCGYQVLRSQVSSMQRWGAACRFCSRKGLSLEEHRDYLKKLEENDPKGPVPLPSLGPAAKNAVEVLARGETLGDEDLKKLALERVETATTVKVDAPPGAEDQVDKLQCPFPACKRVFILRGKLATHVMRVHQELLLRGLGPYVEEATRSSDSETGRGRKRRAAGGGGGGSSSGSGPGEGRRTSSGASTKRERPRQVLNGTNKVEYDLDLAKWSQEQHLGFTLDNLVRWDDSSRTRLGLLPLQPPQGSGAFETGPHRLFRLAVQGGKVSHKWNAVMNDDEETVFGVTNAEQCYQHAQQLGLGRRQRLKRAQARRKRAKHGQGNGVVSGTSGNGSNSNGGAAAGDDGDANTSAVEDGGADDDGPSEKFMTGLDQIRLLRPPPRQVFQCGLDVFSRSFFARARATTEDGCLFALTEAQVARMAPRRMLPVPSRQPRPPSSTDLEETAWVSEAGRLVGVARRRVDGFSADGDPFEKIGLKPLSRKESVGLDNQEDTEDADIEKRLLELAPSKLSLMDAHRAMQPPVDP